MKHVFNDLEGVCVGRLEITRAGVHEKKVPSVTTEFRFEDVQAAGAMCRGSCSRWIGASVAVPARYEQTRAREFRKPAQLQRAMMSSASCNVR